MICRISRFACGMNSENMLAVALVVAKACVTTANSGHGQ